MKKGIILIGAIVLMMAGGNAFSQEGDNVADRNDRKEERKNLSPEEKASKKTQKMTEKLGLDANQATQIEAINLSFILEMDKIKEEQKALKIRAKEQMEKKKEEIDAVLNDDQKEKWAELREERKKEHKENKENKGNCHDH